MIHLLHYGEDLCLSWCRGHRHRLIVFSCSATTSCSGVCRLVQMTKGMGWECVVKWHRVTKSENNIKRLEIKANIMNNKWAQGKEKWWVMGLKEFVIIINNFFFQDMTPWHCLWCCENTNLHALTCLMAQWTIKRWSTLCAYKVSYHRNCLGHLPQLVMLCPLPNLSPCIGCRGDLHHGHPPIHSSTQFILKLWLWFRPACLNRIN